MKSELKISVCTFYKAALPTSPKLRRLAISWSHFPCLTCSALRNVELAGRLYYYTEPHLKASATAGCSCPAAEAKLLARSRATPLFNKPGCLSRASPSLQSRAAELHQHPTASIARFKPREATGFGEGPFAPEFTPTSLRSC